MAHLDIDFAAPVALLIASIVGVLLVRFVASRALELARRRTQQLLRAQRVTASDDEPGASSDRHGHTLTRLVSQHQGSKDRSGVEGGS